MVEAHNHRLKYHSNRVALLYLSTQWIFLL
nr:MAG TPA: hypothetical protein [Crassvirales sp.]DAM76589.1 MAG TPA: hypothetical protein [Caudoviricetes sp.]